MPLVGKLSFIYHLLFQFLRRLVASLTQARLELDRERQGTEDMRREIQSYVNQVRQVEAILARKVYTESLT